ncbi:MAG TPA: hypothetical protein VF406_21315 [Thermodesulfobacteriota bacterium]
MAPRRPKAPRQRRRPAGRRPTTSDNATRARRTAPPRVPAPPPNPVLERARAAAEAAVAEITDPRQHAFLVAFATCANITRAAAAAGIHRDTHYAWHQAEGPAGDAYRAAFARARLIARDVLRDQAYHLAVEGTMRPIVSGGGVVTWVREYETSVLLRLLEAHDPKHFRPRQTIEHDGKVQLAPPLDLSRLTDAELDELERLQAKARRR